MSSFNASQNHGSQGQEAPAGGMADAVDAVDAVDVAIVGYGPVGQTLAAILGQRGHRVAVLERHPGLYPLPRACHLDGETMRTLQSIGIAGSLAPSFHRQSGYEFFDARGDLIHRIDFTAGDGSGWAAGYFFFGPDLELELDAAARRHPGVQVRFSQRVTELAVREGGVDLTLAESPSGAAGRLRARYVVGADGANSTVRELAGFEWQDLSYAAEWLVVDLRPATPEATHLLAEACQILDPRRPVSAFRWIGHDHARLEFMLLPGEQAEDMAKPERVWELLAPFELTTDNCTVIRRAVYMFRSLLASDFARPPVLLAGDAAHLMPPFLGQGMCAGIRDAAALGWRLDQALRGPVPPDLFDSYDEERRTHVKAVIDASIAVGRILGATPDTVGEHRDARRMKADLEALPGPMPPLSAGAIVKGDPLAGSMFPQFPLSGRDGRSALFDDVTGRGWRVVGASMLPGPGGHTRAMAQRCAIEFVAIGHDVTEDEPHYATWLSEHKILAAMVRPDSLIYGTARTPGELDTLIAGVRALIAAT